MLRVLAKTLKIKMHLKEQSLLNTEKPSPNLNSDIADIYTPSKLIKSKLQKNLWNPSLPIISKSNKLKEKKFKKRKPKKNENTFIFKLNSYFNIFIFQNMYFE